MAVGAELWLTPNARGLPEVMVYAGVLVQMATFPAGKVFNAWTAGMSSAMLSVCLYWEGI